MRRAVVAESESTNEQQGLVDGKFALTRHQGAQPPITAHLHGRSECQGVHSSERTLLGDWLSAALGEVRTQLFLGDVGDTQGGMRADGWRHLGGWRETTNRRSSPRRKRRSFFAYRFLPFSVKPRLAGCRDGGWARNGASLGPCLLIWVASGPDRHDLELYDRKARGDTEHGDGGELPE